MRIHLRLHGILRDRLPAEAKGLATLDLPDGARVADVITQLGLEGRYLHFARNEAMLDEPDSALADGDTLEVFLPSAGG